jgi:hypothetical protein
LAAGSKLRPPLERAIEVRVAGENNSRSAIFEASRSRFAAKPADRGESIA